MKERADLEGRSFSPGFNQTKKFVQEIQIGDLALSLNSSSLCIGKVQSDAFIDKNAVELKEVGLENCEKMYYTLRRTVNWGPIFSRDSLPHAVVKSLRAQQTVFNIDDHWEPIYHLMFPMFLNEGKLHISLKLGTRNEISTYDISGVFSLLAELEALAAHLASVEGKIEEIDFNTLFKQYVSRQAFELTSKSEFYSPGDVWSKGIR